MKLWKKSFTLRFPLWSLILIAILVIAAVVLLVLSRTNFWLNLRLHTLDMRDVRSITLYMDDSHSTKLDTADTEQMVKLLNRVKLEGYPYVTTGWLGSGPLYSYTVTLKNGEVLYLDNTSSIREYCYHINGKLYYAGNPEDSPCPVLDEWEQLYKEQCIKYFN